MSYRLWCFGLEDVEVLEDAECLAKVNQHVNGSSAASIRQELYATTVTMSTLQISRFQLLCLLCIESLTRRSRSTGSDRC